MTTRLRLAFGMVGCFTTLLCVEVDAALDGVNANPGSTSPRLWALGGFSAVADVLISPALIQFACTAPPRCRVTANALNLLFGAVIQNALHSAHVTDGGLLITAAVSAVVVACLAVFLWRMEIDEFTDIPESSAESTGLEEGHSCSTLSWEAGFGSIENATVVNADVADSFIQWKLNMHSPTWYMRMWSLRAV